MPKTSLESVTSLVIRSRAALKLTQAELGASAGWSARTQRRYEAGLSTPVPNDLIKLGRLVSPVDAELGAELTRRGEDQAVALGLAPPKPLPPPSSTALSRAAASDSGVASFARTTGAIETKAITMRHMLDAIVCAATDQGELLPREIRPILLAAFARAEELGLEVSEVRRALEVKKEGRGAKRALSE